MWRSAREGWLKTSAEDMALSTVETVEVGDDYLLRLDECCVD